MIAERRFAATPASVREARRFVADCLKGLDADTTDRLLLMASELATNAVEHAATSFVVRLEQAGRELRVAVTDVGSGWPELRSPRATEPRGRGLRIVEALCKKWGVVQSGAGATTVWFTLIAHHPASAVRATGDDDPATAGNGAEQ